MLMSAITRSTGSRGGPGRGLRGDERGHGRVLTGGACPMWGSGTDLKAVGSRTVRMIASASLSITAAGSHSGSAAAVTGSGRRGPLLSPL